MFEKQPALTARQWDVKNNAANFSRYALDEAAIRDGTLVAMGGIVLRRGMKVHFTAHDGQYVGTVLHAKRGLFLLKTEAGETIKAHYKARHFGTRILVIAGV